MVYKSMDGLRPTRLGQREPKASESRGSRDETEASLDFGGKTVSRRRIGRNFARGLNMLGRTSLTRECLWA